MLIIKFIILLIMWLGLICTLGPRLYGTVIILLAAIVYAAVADMSVLQTWVAVSLLTLVLVAELGARGLRCFLTRHYEISRIYSVNTMVCNLAGIIVTDVLLGSLVGAVSWQAIASRILYPRLDNIGKVLARLAVTAVLRFLCGLTMMIIILIYIM